LWAASYESSGGFVAESTYKVLTVNRHEDWESQFGPMRSFYIGLEGEGEVQLRQKPETPAPREGDELFGHVESGPRGKLFKKAQRNGSGGFSGGQKDYRAMAGVFGGWRGADGHDEFVAAQHALRDALGFPSVFDVIQWSDRSGKEVVLAGFDKAIAQTAPEPDVSFLDEVSVVTAA
jgi:hypothetical protein